MAAVQSQSRGPLGRLHAGVAVRIEIEAPRSVSSAAMLTARATLFNDSFEPVEIDRNAFIGPDAVVAAESGPPAPENVEATFGASDATIVLQPFTYFGREREIGILPPGTIEVTARYEGHGEEPVRASVSVVVEA